jgi:endo-1,4-beta-mannosidase
VQVDAPPLATSAPRERPQDALSQALNAVRAAAQAVREGAYGRAPASGVRETRTYKLWAEMVEAVDGGQGSLLRALQDRGFAKTRKS